MEDVHMTQEIVNHTFHMASFLEGTAVGLGTLLAGLVPLLQWIEKKRAAKREVAKKAEEEAAKKAPKFLEENEFKKFKDQDFENFKSQNNAQHQELAAIVERSAHQAGEAVTKLETIGANIKDTVQNNTIKQLETLALIREGISSSLGAAHEKANDALNTSASLDGRVKSLEDRVRKTG